MNSSPIFIEKSCHHFLQNFRRSFVRPLLLTLSISAASASWALSATVEQFVKWETEGNAVSRRSSKVFAIKHYEVPLALVQQDFASYLDPAVKSALIFKKDGVDYVRWIINPEDTKWHKAIEKLLLDNGLDATQHTHFSAYLTASRSIILEDPVSHAQFSAKVSTNQTGGMWKDKKQPIDDAEQVRMVSDFVHDTSAKTNFDRLIIEDDPLEMGIKEIDQALLVRSLADLPTGDHYYLPGFSAVHEKVGAEIARLNGSVNPAEFWNEHYNKPLAEAVAEFAAHFGITYDSPHSQNFLVELDKNMKPTGKIVFRDFGDSYAQGEWFKALGRDAFLKRWEAGNITTGYLDVTIGPMHGNSPPSWLSEAQYKQWGADFYKAFEEKFSQMTGIPTSELSTGRIGYQSPFSYFSKNYSTRSASWKRYLAMAKCFAGSPVAADGTPCPEHLVAKLKQSHPSEPPTATASNVIKMIAKEKEPIGSVSASPNCGTDVAKFLGRL